ncbi:kelch-like protein 11 [Saccoglossus kowalevskii]|uniref:Kelch-like protein 11-like n=1 Tax=Saccoglossus kowalevskii TaxID=10224 RepID=A0ABM0LUZ3_SACKO|nr:PREDICTED: kelch-like protein 11-like [Saccoglossus kowalevskii]
MADEFVYLENLKDQEKVDEYEILHRLKFNNDILSHLNDQRKNGVLCDMTLVVDKHEFNAHKCMLVACSPYFESLLRCNWREAQTGKVELECTSVEGMEAILNYMYTGVITLSMDTVEDIIRGADHLLLTTLKRKCENFVIDRLDARTCLWALQILQPYFGEKDFPCLRVKSLRVLAYRFSEVLQDKECEPLLMQLSANSVCDILAHANLAVRKEEDLFEFLLKWVNHARKEREKDFSRLFCKLHLSQVDTQYLTGRIQKESLVQHNHESRKYVTDVLNFTSSPDTSPDVEVFKPRPARLVDVVVCLCQSNGGPLLGYLLEERYWIYLSQLEVDCDTIFDELAVGLGNRLLSFCSGWDVPDSGDHVVIKALSYMYDPLTDHHVNLPSSPKYHYTFGKALVCCGKVYLIGGEAIQGVDALHRNSFQSGLTVEMLDPGSTSCWVEKQPLPEEPGCILHAVATKDRYIYVVCYGSGLLKVLRLDTECDIWRSVFRIEVANQKECIPCIEIKKEDRIEVQALNNTAVVIPYNTSHDVYTKESTFPQIPILRIGAGVCNIKGDIFVCGGHDSSEDMLATDSVCMFDSSSQSWVDLPQMPEKQIVTTCALLQMPYFS